MRRQPLLSALWLAAASLAACNQRPEHCAEAYRHLVALVERDPTAEEAERFVDACVAAWDEARVACLVAAASPDEALACKPKKIRPG